MKTLRRIYYRIFKRYVVLETRCFYYSVADKMIRNTANEPEEERWVLAKEEDGNRVFGMVYLCRRKRIVE